MSNLGIRVFTIILTAAALQAQNIAPRGTTRLEAGGLRLMHGGTAVYPEAARNSGIEGAVVIEASLDQKGHVADARVLSGPMELRAVALKSILDDHFASDGSISRKAQLSMVFTLQKPGPNPIPPSVDFGSPPPSIVSIECPMVPDELCRDGRQRLGPSIGSALTPEKMAELRKQLADLDDHLVLVPRRTSAGMALAFWLRYETGFDVVGGVPGGVLGGIISSVPSSAPPPPPPPPRREAPPAGQRITVSGAVQAANLIRQTKPVYPALAKEGRVQGAVILSAIIGKDGAVQDLRLISGHPLLILAALEAVKQWRYQPTLFNGEPVEVITQITLTFTLSQ